MYFDLDCYTVFIYGKRACARAPTRPVASFIIWGLHRAVDKTFSLGVLERVMYLMRA